MTKAASIRADFARDLEEVTSWLGGAEARVLDRGTQPAALKVNKLHLKVNKQLTSAKFLISLKERLAEVSCEIGAKTEQVERLNKNGQSLAERWVSGSKIKIRAVFFVYYVLSTRGHGLHRKHVLK